MRRSSQQPCGKSWRAVRLTLVSCGSLLLLVLLLVRSVCAGSGDVIQLPQSNLAPKNGLRLTIDTKWVDANGYRPVRITAQPWPPGPALANRRLQIELSPARYFDGRETDRTSGSLLIPEGATQAETTLAVPQSTKWASLHIAVYEDGHLLEDLSGTPGSLQRMYDSDESEALPTILIIDADAPAHDTDSHAKFTEARLAADKAATAPAAPLLPDLRQLPRAFMVAQYSPSTLSYAASPTGGPISTAGIDDLKTLELLGFAPHIELIPPSALPQRWLDFTCFDMIFVSAADLETLVAQHGPSWQAARDWLAAGPTLCVYDMELSHEKLARLETLLELSAPAQDEQPDGIRAGWRAPNPNKASSDTVAALDQLAMNRNEVAVTASSGASQSPNATTPPPPPTPPAHPPFLIHDVNLGRVVAMRASEPLLFGRYETPWLLSELGTNTWMWYQRHGISLQRENSDYWNWMVPGIGRTPVGVFLILIALFVVLIGPVNYYLLRRWRRLYLLVVTVPAGAAVVAAALFVYALMGDGLGVRVRVRGLVEIDQRGGRIVSWSRQSYYAGLAPSEGLRFPERTAVYPIERWPRERHAGSMPARHLIWDGDQNLAAGYVRSRSTAEFLVINSGPITGGLRLVEGQSDPPSLRVTNELSVTLDTLAAWDSAGHGFWCEDLEPGAAASMVPIADAGDALQRVLAQHQPGFPPGYNPHDYRGPVGYGRRWYYFYNDADRNLPPPEFRAGILECGLQKAAGMGLSSQAEPRSYVAFSHVSVGVPLGYSEAREEASIYLIHGKW